MSTPQTGKAERLCIVTVTDTGGGVLLREKWLTAETPKQIREKLVGEEYGTFDRHEVVVRVRNCRAQGRRTS